MTNAKKKGDGRRRAGPAKSGKSPSKPADGKSPEWTKGLRQLYDSVVDEPLPDAFKSLLDKLDKK